MTVDILIGITVIVTAVLGLRDGLVRKFVSLAGTVIGIIAGQIFKQDAAQLISEYIGVDVSTAPTVGFFAVLLFVQLLAAIIYKLVVKEKPELGIAGRIAGGILGFGQGLILISVVLVMLTTVGFPSSSEAKQSSFYKTVVNIAPQMFDFAEQVNAEYLQQPPQSTPVKQRLEQAKKQQSKADSLIKNIRKQK